MNWAALKPSQTMASLIRHEESIRSIHSHNKQAEKNIGRQQRGGTATITNKRLACLLKTPALIIQDWEDGRGIY